jgi:hypothetical protein
VAETGGSVMSGFEREPPDAGPAARRGFRRHSRGIAQSDPACGADTARNDLAQSHYRIRIKRYIFHPSDAGEVPNGT